MENKVDNGDSGRRRFIRRLTTLGAAGGIATLLYGRVTEKPLIQLAQAASGDYLSMSNVNTTAGGTELDSTASGGQVLTVYGAHTASAIYAHVGGAAQGIVGVSDNTSSPWGQGVIGCTEGVAWPGADRIGVEGLADTGAGVVGKSQSGNGVSGYTTSGFGVRGLSQATSSSSQGVVGLTENLSPPAIAAIGVQGTASTGTGVQGSSNTGTGTLGISLSGYCVHGWAWGSNAKPLVAQGYLFGQTANLQEWQDSLGNPLAAVDASGNFGLGISTPARQLHIRGSNAVARLDRNVDSASFIFTRTNADYSQVLKSFTFGVKATGVDAGSFFIGDMHTNVSGSSDNRILIDTSGNVGIGTTTPSSKLHVNGRVKALGYDTGDITYANGIKTTEEGTGLAFLNDAGEKIAVLDRQGNWHIKGDIIKDL